MSVSVRVLGWESRPSLTTTRSAFAHVTFSLTKDMHCVQLPPLLGRQWGRQSKSGVPSRRGKSEAGVACILYTSMKYPANGLSHFLESEDGKSRNGRWPAVERFRLWLTSVSEVTYDRPAFPRQVPRGDKPCVRTTVRTTVDKDNKTISAENPETCWLRRGV
jgi:hypothetical protein